MAKQSTTERRGAIGHGAAELSSVTIETYNAELRDSEGFIGDRASKRAFQSIMNDWRERLRAVSDDPLGETPTEELGKKKLDRLLVDGDVEAAGLVHSAIEEFAQELAGVIRRFLRLKTWRDVTCIVVGGGLRASRVGELAIGRAALLLKGENGRDIQLKPIRHHPDQAGLIGAMHLAPKWILDRHDSILSVDIGGTNMRAGVVELNREKANDLSEAHVMDFDLWRHRNDEPTRDEAVEELGTMLHDLVQRAEKRHKLAPFIGIGCPGIINEDGSIARGGQNLPGNWEHSDFNLPERIRALIPEIGGVGTLVVMHNDAVVQGLSEIPSMVDVDRWGVLTVGTGLGNASFRRRILTAESASGLQEN